MGDNVITQPVEVEYFQEGNIMSDACFWFELRNGDARMILEKCHAENDDDRKTIVLIENAVERDPYLSEAMLTNWITSDI
jgi:hypothetical protein